MNEDTGAASPKPTGLTTDLELLHGRMSLGWPAFTERGRRYVGPLPADRGFPRCACGVRHGELTSPGATSDAADWPPGLCALVAQAMVITFVSDLGACGVPGVGNEAPTKRL